MRRDADTNGNFWKMDEKQDSLKNVSKSQKVKTVLKKIEIVESRKEKCIKNKIKFSLRNY